MTPDTTHPFPSFFEPSTLAQTALRSAVTQAWRTPEPEAVALAVAGARVSADESARIKSTAVQLATALRERKSSGGRAGLVQSLLQEYALSSHEGVALMCLAEALLRIPDVATRDALIRDKISQGQWVAHLGRSPSLFVNAATWGLLITGRLVGTHSESGLSSALTRLVGLGGEPLIRKGVDMAMRMMGEQFVTGESIDEALSNARERESEGFRYSFDMLGEAALTAADAARYLREYQRAIDAIGQASAGKGVYGGAGISIKLSALHPRYSVAQQSRVMAELYPRLLQLCLQARQYDIGLNIDAEESDRLELSLDLLEKLALEEVLNGWSGLGFVIQAYQKRCPMVIDYVVDLARRSGRRLMIRLVKGAYWDSEIKRAQVDGMPGYPVYTRKHHTDAAYIACARKLLAAPDAVYPQFATHNAQTVATIYHLAEPARYTPQQYEFQCLHGMGEPLYEQVVGLEAAGKLGRPCRIYAPVGTHETLLAYLVRRLLENGANTSFVNQIADRGLDIEALVRDPVEQIDALARVEGACGLPHPAIGLPVALYGAERPNSAGVDLASTLVLVQLTAAMQQPELAVHDARPLVHGLQVQGTVLDILNPACHTDRVGGVVCATSQHVDLALEAALAGAAGWAATAPGVRAVLLEKTADQLQDNMAFWVALLIREAGKSASNAVAEVREAIDFLRYYAAQIRTHFDNRTHIALGPVVCISPWNFPLAIFVGQVAAALAAGNTVLAKPAEQTPLVAAAAVRAMHAAGIPTDAVQLLPGDGATVGAQLVADPRVQGVLFTGSTEVARLLQAGIAGRLTRTGKAIPLIAETGGQNAMVVDSSALVEQVVTDVLVSAFDSAGQRCSALRVLCVQDDAAGRVLEMLLGAMAQLQPGDPSHLCTDVGPVIDAEAKGNIDRHIATMRNKGCRVHQIAGQGAQDLTQGTYVLPTLIEIDRIADLTHEVFGPVLHMVRYQREDLDGLLAQINATGFGLTMGLHTRMDETIARVTQASHAGNVYVNRNMVGAVVGVQPFGGEGLSGTGPKAGGPLYLFRLLQRRPEGVLHTAMPTQATPESASGPGVLQVLARWAQEPGQSGDAAHLPQVCKQFAGQLPAVWMRELTGPTGERNVYSLVPRNRVLCLAANPADRLTQLAAVLAVGGTAVWPSTADPLKERLPEEIRQRVVSVHAPFAATVACDAVILHGSAEEMRDAQNALHQRGGAVTGVERLNPGDTAIALERLVVERAVSINTAAAGGNASLMTIG